MPDPIQKKLNAYLDGELNRQERLEVERHIEVCAECRSELDDMMRVSRLLHEANIPDFTSPADFKAQVVLQLPRRDMTTPAADRSRFLWVAPVIVVFVFIFIQVTLNLSTLVSWAGQVGWINVDTGTPSQMLWFSALQWLPGDLLNTPGLAWLNVVNNAGLFTQNMLITFIVQSGFAILYWGVFTLAWRKTVGSQWAGLTGN
jgi:hypothetical protein